MILDTSGAENLGETLPFTLYLFLLICRLHFSFYV